MIKLKYTLIINNKNMALNAGPEIKNDTTSSENLENIDNESINTNMNKLDDFIKERIENKEVLKILNTIDSNAKIDENIDIDMSYDKINKKYYLMIN
jgi:hypothetical protein